MSMRIQRLTRLHCRLCGTRRPHPGLTLAWVVLLFLANRAGLAQHLSLWGGGGVGFFLHGGPGIRDANGHKFFAVALSLARDQFRIRYIRGSLERSKGIPADTGDNDLDYFGFDGVLTQKLAGLPIDLAIGVARYEEAYHEGYPVQDLGGRVLVHRWGPHLSVLRSVRFARFLEAWAEADLHYAPYQPKQYVVFVDVGIGVHF